MKIGDKFVKDSEVVKVFSKDAYRYNDNGVICCISDVVIFGVSNKILDAKILTERDFLEQYKPLVEYEYQYFVMCCGLKCFTEHLTDEEFKKNIPPTHRSLFTKQIETKRERVQ